MKNTLLLAVITFISANLFAQSSEKWKASLEPQKVFIENKSQFDGKEKLKNSEILFGTDESPVMIYFTKKGLTYSFTKTEIKRKSEEERLREKREMKVEREEEEHQATITKDVIQMEWENANPDVQVIPMQLTESYFTHEKVNHAKAYRKLVYKNLYPNIDAEYVFHAREGIKYSLILHPGADVSQVRMKYSGTNRISVDENGNTHIATVFGDMIDHAPVSFYEAVDGSSIPTHFVRNGKTVSFVLDNYDSSQRVVIDPWTITPTLPNSNSAFYIKADSTGNSYIYGGDSPFRLQKYNTTGALQWTYNSPWNSASRWFGALATDRSGNSYITNGDGATLAKISTTGSFEWSHTSGNTFTDLIEFWATDFNCDETELYIGGMSAVPFAFDFRGTIFKMNLTNGTISGRVSVVHPALSISNEVRSLCSTPDGKIHYLSLDTVGSITNSLAITYGIRSTYAFPYYLPYSNTGGGQGQNNIRASSQFLYSCDGATLHKRDVTTGAVISSTTVPQGSANNNSGLAIDSCGNVYVGAQTRVVKYDANLNLLLSMSTIAPVFDVSIGTNGDVLACGQNFAVALAMSACSPMRAICFTPLSASTSQTNLGCGTGCNGTATVNPQGGTAPFTYLWSAGAQATRTAVNLCAGSYTVTITDAASVSATASVTIIQTGSVSLSASTVNTSCGNSNGSATIAASTGNAPFIYSWNTGDSTATITNVAAGTYYVTVTDAGGCTGTASAIVNPSGNTPVSISANDTLICTGDSSIICAPSGYAAYLWNTGETGECISAKYAGNYYVTVTDQGNCTATSNRISVRTYPLPSVSISINGDSLIAYNAENYQWYYNGSPIPGATSYIFVPTQTGEYSVAVTDSNGCTASSTRVNMIVSGIDDLMQEEDVRVYPNPLTFGSWQLTVGGKMIGGEVEIFDAEGRLVYKSEIRNRQTEIDLDISHGIYMMRVSSDQKNVTLKLIRL